MRSRKTELTGRENEVAARLASGWNSHEIAEALHVSVKTVDTHRGHILEKLDLRGSVELSRYWRDTGQTYVACKSYDDSLDAWRAKQLTPANVETTPRVVEN